MPEAEGWFPLLGATPTLARRRGGFGPLVASAMATPRAPVVRRTSSARRAHSFKRHHESSDQVRAGRGRLAGRRGTGSWVVVASCCSRPPLTVQPPACVYPLLRGLHRGAVARIRPTASRRRIQGRGCRFRVETTRRRAAACGHRAFNAGFPAMNPIGRPSQPDPSATYAALNSSSRSSRSDPSRRAYGFARVGGPTVYLAGVDVSSAMSTSDEPRALKQSSNVKYSDVHNWVRSTWPSRTPTRTRTKRAPCDRCRRAVRHRRHRLRPEPAPLPVGAARLRCRWATARPAA